MSSFPHVEIYSFTKGDKFIKKTKEHLAILKKEFKDSLSSGIKIPFHNTP